MNGDPPGHPHPPVGGDPAEGARSGEAATAPADGEAVEPRFDPVRRAIGAWAWRIPVLLAAGGAVAGAVQAYRVHFAKIEPTTTPSFEEREQVAVAPVAQFAEDYAASEFFLAALPCLAVRVPDPIPGSLPLPQGGHLIGFSRMCTHQACLVDLNRDLEAVAFAFNHRSDRPSLTCACHFSVFDPLRAGRAVSGPAVRPLPRVRLAIDGAIAIATGIETSA